MNRVENESRSWKQEPLVWMIIAIPFSAIVMGVVIITLAIQSYSGLVVDDYYKKGKQINRVIARDQFAYELGLSAAMTLGDSGSVEIRFDPSVTVVPGGEIELSLVHATKPGLDRRLILDRDDERLLSGKLRIPGEGRWNVNLQTADWRLTGSLRFPDQARVELQPAYTPDNR